MVKSCSFCHKPKSEVGKLISGDGQVLICEVCIKECYDLLDDSNVKQEVKVKLDIASAIPRKLYEYMNQFVIGQDYAKKVLSVAVYNHYKRLSNKSEDEVDLVKSNVLLLGPTGSGKTLMAQCMAKALSVPFTIVDATSLTEAGYVGDDVESIIHSLLVNADFDLQKTEMGIIYVDEIDKIGRKSGNPSITRDVSGEGVQQALLKMFEGTVVSVPPKGGRKHPDQEYIRVNTKDILFICAGAFNGLDNIIKSRLDRQSIGFSANVKKHSDHTNIIEKTQAEDLVKFGLIPELIGRLPVVTSLQELTDAQLAEVLLKPKNSLVKQYKYLFSLDEVELEFTDDAIEQIAKFASKRKSGARGLRAIFEKMLLESMFSNPESSNKKQVIDKQFVIEKIEK